MKLSPRLQFLIINGLKGILWMSIILGVYFLFKEIVISKNPDVWIDRFYARPEIIYLVYFVSEFFLGILPPELFMIWAYNKAGVSQYILNVAFFGMVSYFMGYLTFLIGQFLHRKAAFRYFRSRYLKEQLPLLKKYGLFLIIIAALTPVPWSASSLLVGSVGYPSKKYLQFALFRILRFLVYGYIVFQTHQI